MIKIKTQLRSYANSVSPRPLNRVLLTKYIQVTPIPTGTAFVPIFRITVAFVIL